MIRLYRAMPYREDPGSGDGALNVSRAFPTLGLLLRTGFKIAIHSTISDQSDHREVSYLQAW